MVKSSEDQIPLTTNSPSITGETKVKFNQLLSDALNKDVAVTPLVFGRAISAESSQTHFDGVPKIVPRQRKKVNSLKTEFLDTPGDVSSIYSSEDSARITRVKSSRAVIEAEIHTSRTNLVQSSSDDDILSEKKEKKKKKKSRWKRGSEAVISAISNEGQINEVFHMNEKEERSSSRLSGRSYTVQSPIFFQEMSQTPQSKTESNIPQIDSPSRLSNRSYIVETPTFPIDSNNKNETSLPRIKTPIPLPRRKPIVKLSTDQIEERTNITPDKDLLKDVSTAADLNNIAQSESLSVRETSTKISETIGDSAPNLQRINHSPINDYVDAHPDQKQKRKKKQKRHILKSCEELELQVLNQVIDSKEDTISEHKSGSCSLRKYSSTKESINESHSSNYIGPSDQVVGVTVHGVDCALVNPLVRHPIVRLHLINTDTGQYVTKSDPTSSVCYYSEHSDYILPIATHPFHFKHHKTVLAQWEECLLLNEKPSHLFTPATLFLFEVCDFVNASVASARHHELGSAAAWHVIAWAFLRPIGASGARNLDSKLKLQLYKPSKFKKNVRSRLPMVYEWWNSVERCKYAGCLSVTVEAVAPPFRPPSPRLRSRLAMQSEVASIASARSASGAAVADDCANKQQSMQEVEDESPVVWSRLAAQVCKLPTTRLASLPVDGCMAVQFSPCGLWLACALRDIQLYSVPQFQHSSRLTGHQGLVYCLRWSADSKLLLSTSADSTVSLWRPHHHTAPLLQILAHPSYVYSAVFVGAQSLVTGCCDGTVRLWQRHADTYRLIQELSEHAGFVSAVCVTVNSSHVLTADSHGSIKIYQLDNDGCLSEGLELRVRELQGTVINNVLIHPGGHRLLVHSRDNCVRSVDIATGAVLQTFKGCSNERMQTGACLSACGSLLFACGEEGSLVVWNGHTGSLKAVYLHLLPPGSAAVHYHPHDHLLAVASLQAPPLHILTYDRHSSGEDIGLNLITKEVSCTADIINKMFSTRDSSKKLQKTSATSQSTPSITVDLYGDPKKLESNNINITNDNTIIPTFYNNNPRSLPSSEMCTEKYSQDKDERLLEIIRKMDSIILAARQSSQSPSLQVQ